MVPTLVRSGSPADPSLIQPFRRRVVADVTGRQGRYGGGTAADRRVTERKLSRSDRRPWRVALVVVHRKGSDARPDAPRLTEEPSMTRLSGVVAACATLALASSPLLAGSATAHSQTARHHEHHHHAGALPGGFKHLVVIYEENHSFDNLYGHWGRVGHEDVDGVAQATPERTTQ